MTVKRCLEYITKHHADYAIFPEYTYTPELSDLYKKHSQDTTIIGGSYQSPTNHNETVIAHLGELYYCKKINLSPLEHSVFRENRLRSGDNPFYFVDKNNLGICVLTCFDYHKLARDITMSKLKDGNMVDMIFSPSCERKPDNTFIEANATHNQRDSFYSIICNVASMKISNGNQNPDESYTECRGSCVFGIYDPIIRNQIIDENLCDEKYKNMILLSPSGQNMAIITLEIPYHRYRRYSMEYVENPRDIEVIKLDSVPLSDN